MVYDQIYGLMVRFLGGGWDVVMVAVAESGILININNKISKELYDNLIVIQNLT